MDIEVPGHATSLEVIVPRRTIPRTARPVTLRPAGHHPHRRRQDRRQVTSPSCRK
jgi:hypothetical protein